VASVDDAATVALATRNLDMSIDSGEQVTPRIEMVEFVEPAANTYIIPRDDGGWRAGHRPELSGAIATSTPQEIWPGLWHLLQAREYARQLQEDVWTFAVEVECLHAAGLTNNDLRWMICKRWVEHAEEVYSADSVKRTFRPTGMFSITPATCFVLTQAGVEFVAQSTNRTPADERRPVRSAMFSFRPFALGAGASSVEVLRPRWDADRHRLFFGDWLVKEFKLASLNQERILMAFQEDGWPPRIDDPLPIVPVICPKRRLHDAIKGLNRNQKQPLIRFMGDGTGEGVLWEPQHPNRAGS
jgi:hypothetical protein